VLTVMAVATNKVAEGLLFIDNPACPCLIFFRCWSLPDLDLWAALLHVFDRVAITKETMLRIQHGEGPLSTPSETVVRLRETIRSHFNKIEQPGAICESPIESRDGGLEETKSPIPAGRHAFYSNDVFSRVYVPGDKEHELGFNTGQLILQAEQLGCLEARDVGRITAQPIRWDVGFLTLENRHLLHCLPRELTTSRHLKQRIAALHQGSRFPGTYIGCLGHSQDPYGDPGPCLPPARICPSLQPRERCPGTCSDLGKLTIAY